MATKNNRSRTYNLIVILALLLSILSLSLGYAAYNNYLKIDNKIYLKGKDWLIKLDNLSTPKLEGNAKIVENPIILNASISMFLSFDKSGDQVEYTFDVVNEGNLNAKLDSVPVITGIPEEEKTNIEYSFTYDDGTEIKKEDELNSGESKKIKVKIKYLGPSEHSQDRNFDIDTTLLYIQK